MFSKCLGGVIAGKIQDLCKLTQNKRNASAFLTILPSTKSTGLDVLSNKKKKEKLHMQDKQAAAAYWKENIRLLLSLLVIWFIVSFGCGILFVDQLDTIKVGGFPLGFWFAQQGSIYGFLAIIFFYIWRMNRLDHKYNVYEEEK